MTLHIRIQKTYRHDQYKKEQEKLEKFQFFFGLFRRSSPFSSKMNHRNESFFFALLSVRQDASFKLSNVAIQRF